MLRRLGRVSNANAEQRVVVAHPDHFFYGNIAADIINFKKYGGLNNHCHNWNIQDRLESLVTTETERAFMLGYLCHLATDVTAHNHFVPFHLVFGLPPKYLGHPYWEALADGSVSDADWDIVARIKRNRTISRNDRLIHKAVKWKALGMRSNKWIFNNILLLNLRKSWRDIIRTAHTREKLYPLQEAFFEDCRRRCIDDMLAVFERQNLMLLKLRDPTGRAALRSASRMRRELRRRYFSVDERRELSRHLAQAAFGEPGKYPTPSL